MSAIPLSWQCSMCGWTGMFPLKGHTGVRMALQQAKDEHALASPRCHMENQGRHVRVTVNEDPR